MIETHAIWTKTFVLLVNNDPKASSITMTVEILVNKIKTGTFVI